MSLIVICPWRSSLIFMKSNFSRRGSGNLLSSYQLIDAAQFEDPSSGHTKTAHYLLAHAYQLQMQLLSYQCPLL